MFEFSDYFVIFADNMRRPSFTMALALLSCAALFLAFIILNDAVGFVVILVMLGIAGTALTGSLVSQIKNTWIQSVHRLHSRDFSLKLTATLMGLFLVVGTLMYIYVFGEISLSDSVMYTLNDDSRHHVEFNNVELLLRSLICSLDLFMLDVDSNILDRLDDRPMLKACLSIQAVLSFSCTVMMLVGLVYSRLSAYIQLNYHTKINSSHNHLYLFFGINSRTENLVRDILKHGNDPEAVIVLIDEANVQDDTGQWDRIVDLLTHKAHTFEIADRHAVRMAVAAKALRDIDPEIASLDDFDAFCYLGLTRVKRLIEKLKGTPGAQLHIFFLAETENHNLRDIITLAKDRTILSVADSEIRCRIYCHARYNGPNRVIKDVAVKKKLDIKIIDSSHLAVERLKLLPEFHPVNVAEMSQENPATVTGPFESLIVGFGEVGRDVFRFLYEFGAFVADDATSILARRSEFNCTVVDRNIRKIEGAFKAAMPGIFKDGTKDSSIRFMNIDYNSEDFYNEILKKESVCRLNYVVISIGDDDEAIALATRIFNRFRQYGGNLRKLIILVMCTDGSKVESMQKIADHYNQGYADSELNRAVIRIFGQPEETYTYALVVSDRLVELGKKFHESYRAIKQEGPTWDERYKACTDTGIPNIDKLRELRRKESQDIANALHMPTKMAFFTEAMPKPFDREEFMKRYFKDTETPDRTGKRSDITYPGLDNRENLVILRLAMLEHLRWNAAHKLMGYVRRTDGKVGCDETAMCHNCLTDWSCLDAESDCTDTTDYPCDYKEYDFAVVDTTVFQTFDRK